MKRKLKIAFNSFLKDQNIRFSLISMTLIIIVATQLLTVNVIGTTYTYNIGDIALEDIRVHKDIIFKNEGESLVEKRKAAELVPLVFDRDESVLLEKLKIIGILFNNMSVTLEENPPIGTDDLTFQLLALKSRLPKYLLYNDKTLLELIRYKDLDRLKKIIYKILIYIYDNNKLGILDKIFTNPLKTENSNITIRVINASETKDEISRTLYDLVALEDIKKRLYKLCYSISPNLPRNTLNSVVTVVRINLKPNLRFNLEESKRRRIEKINTIKPVMGKLKKGQTIIREGDTVTIEILNKINIINKHAESSNMNYILGLFMMQFVFLVIFGFFILKFKKTLVPNKEASMVIFSVIILFMVYTFFLVRSQSNFINEFSYVLLLPIPFVTMIVSVLFNIYIAMIVGMYIIFFTFQIGGGDITIIILAFSSAILGVFVNGEVEKRTDFLRGGFLLGFMNSIVIVSMALLKGIPVINIVKYIYLSFGSGIINSILVLGIFPIYENIFGITTRFKLFELSDLNAEIFKKMLVEAPGTYHHSLIVSTMAESASNDINANYMLARVGAFYHDIGKINDAEFFIENKANKEAGNNLSPDEYSKLIISHVEKGVKLAKKNGLPETVIDFIREHHGKSTMTFFYHQALEDAANNPDNIIKSDFQYPGPKPRSKETAIVMLADAIEAASRTLKNPDQSSMKELVRKIIYNKLNDGELESSELSMSDLKIIQMAFLKILNGIFHTRIEYPESGELEELEKKVIKNGNKIKG